MSAAQTSTRAGRADPKRRRRDGAASLWKLKNAEADKKYVWVYKNSTEQGVEYYEAIGYEVERCRPDGVKSSAGKVVEHGSIYEQGGYVLMSISKEDAEDIEKHGADGDTGQALFDVIEKKIIDPRGGMDPARGMSSRYFTAINQTKANQLVRPSGTGEVVTD